MKRLKVLCLVAVFCLIFAFSSVAVSPISAKHYIKTNNYTIYIPDQYIEYLDFTDDDILYFRSSSSVSCLLKYNNSNVLYSVSFPSIYRASTNTITYRDFETYYTDFVAVQSGSGTSQIVNHLQPIYYSDIIDSDISFGFDPDHILLAVAVFLFCDFLFKIYMIFSKGKAL